MSQPKKRIVDGVERKIFGEVSAEYISDWLENLVYERLSLNVRQILFRAGRLSAVYGLQLNDNTKVVAKIHRKADLNHLTTLKNCQQLLAASGYPCPTPLDGPTEKDGRVVVFESLLEVGEFGDAHQPPIRQAMAQGLAEQIAILHSAKGLSLSDSGTPPPPWARYENGPWPPPPDPIVDFSLTPAGYEWLDRIAAKAAEALRPRRTPDSIGHCDWVSQNLRFVGSKLVAAYDWDSLIAESEPVLAGLSAGAFTEGNPDGVDAPTPDEVMAFLQEYESARSHPFAKDEQAQAVAAATWVLAYNARWTMGIQTLGFPIGDGSPLEMLKTYGEVYLTIHW